MQFGWRPKFLWTKPNHFNDTYHGRVDLQSLYYTRFCVKLAVKCVSCLRSTKREWKTLKKIGKTSKWQLCQHACCQTERLLVTLAQDRQRHHLISSCKCAGYSTWDRPKDQWTWYAWRCFALCRTSCVELNRNMHWWTNGLRNGCAIQIVERSKQRWLAHVNSITV